jgi:hypothetical protein
MQAPLTTSIAVARQKIADSPPSSVEIEDVSEMFRETCHGATRHAGHVQTADAFSDNAAPPIPRLPQMHIRQPSFRR